MSLTEVVFVHSNDRPEKGCCGNNTTLCRGKGIIAFLKTLGAGCYTDQPNSRIQPSRPIGAHTDGDTMNDKDFFRSFGLLCWVLLLSFRSFVLSGPFQALSQFPTSFLAFVCEVQSQMHTHYTRSFFPSRCRIFSFLCLTISLLVLAITFD